jgi:biopolymer transport protein ExbD
MKLKNRRSKLFFVPLFSMSDIAFLLLIFIMLIALMNYRVEVRIDYPEARTVLNTNAEKNLEVWVDWEGGIYLDGYPADMRELEEAVIELYQNAQDTRVHIIADRSTPYQYINAVVEVLQTLQYRVVSFVVRNVE